MRPGEGLIGNVWRTARPAWFDPAKVAGDLDARPMLAAGEQPVNQAMAELSALAAGAIYKLNAPFLPAPLIDKASSLGFDHWLVREGEESFVVYFFRKS